MGSPHDTGPANLKLVRATNKRMAKEQGEALRKLASIERSKCLVDTLEREGQELITSSEIFDVVPGSQDGRTSGDSIPVGAASAHQLRSRKGGRSMLDLSGRLGHHVESTHDSGQLMDEPATTTRIIKRLSDVRNKALDPYTLWQGDAEDFVSALPTEPQFDLVVSSPPYNIGKSYEKKASLDVYLAWQEKLLDAIIPRIKETGSICWQVGNFVDNGQIVPLDIEMHPIFKKHGLKLRNRIVWHFGHGLHNTRRFSGRYEVVMWYSKSDDYFFDVDPVRVASKYPGKRHFKGPKKGQLSGNPLGKNPDDVWAIPNVKSNHIEKTDHPCQFPVGLIERLVLSMTKPGDLVFDPFSGVGSAGVAAALHQRSFWGCELLPNYIKQGKKRIDDALAGKAKYRPHDKEIYDHTKSNLSKAPAKAAEK